MASRKPRKSAPRRSSSSARKSASRKRAWRKPARSPASRSTRTNRKQAAAKKHSLLFVLCFWPFLLVNRITRSWPGFLRLPVRVGGYTMGAALAVGLLAALIYFGRSLKYDLARVAEMPERSIIYDCNRNELGRLHGAHRYVVDLEEVSSSFRDALLAREDKSFRRHFGVDPRGVARAVDLYLMKSSALPAPGTTMGMTV